MAGLNKNDPRTVFVRGIDASVTNEQLQEYFSEIGPVKNAFLIRRGKDGPHRGFGFVQFALQEDAARAAAELQGQELAGRKLKVEGAVKRAPLEERKKRKQEAAPGPAQQQQQQQQPKAGTAEAVEQQPAAKKPRSVKPATRPDGTAAAAAEGKHKWLRTVAVGGLTAEAVDSAVQMAKSAGEVEEVIQPIPDHLLAHFKLQRDGCTGESLLAVYKTVKQAMNAVTKLHGQAAAAGDGAARKRKGGRGVAPGQAEAGCRVWARQLSGEGMHHKRWRLIIRNLPFTASEAELRQAFEPAGFLWELTVPRSASGRGRGFAFVGFTCKAHAERGIRLVNGQAVAGRTVAVDWALSKALYGSALQQEQQLECAPGAAAEGEQKLQQLGIDGLDSDSEDDGPPAKLGHEDVEGEDGAAAALEPEQERRMVASVIDGILETSDDEGAAGAPADGLEGSEEGAFDEDSGEEQGGCSGQEGEEEQGEEEEHEVELEEREEEQLAGADGAANADPFSRKRLQKKAEEASTAAVLQDGEQSRQRDKPEEGATVFIRGLPLDVSKEQVFLKMKAFGPVRSCRLVVDKESGKLKGTAFVDYYKRASAQAAADACAKGRRKDGPGVVIAGRVADVDLALGQQDVRALAATKAAERGPRDNRRLALAKEGQIEEGSPAWEDMSAGDRAKRKRAAEEKKLKLKSPNFVVSDTRLSVRNIPPSWTEKQLKQAFIAAVKERASKAQPRMRQVKLLVEEERQGADGAPRSKGIGFVEFTEHEHALCALRQLNNNPTTFTKDRRPIVEFALENVKALKLREAKLAKARQPRDPRQQQQEDQLQAAAEAGPSEGVPGAGERGGKEQRDGAADGAEEPAIQKSKRQLRKERRLMLKERRKQQQQAGGDASADAVAATNATQGNAEKSRSARRREQRKRKEGEQGAPVAAAAPLAQLAAATASKPAKPGAGGKQLQQHKQPRHGVNSKVAKAAAVSQQEQQTQRRKRSADELIDKLAQGPEGELRAKSKRRKKEDMDSVDQLAKAYINKYFSDSSAAAAAGKPGSRSKGASASERSTLKRWFQ